MTNEKTPWQKFLEKKEKKDDASIIDLLSKENYIKDQEVVDKRMSICHDCEFFIKATTQCRKCGCFMKLKTKLTTASCPIEKW